MPNTLGHLGIQGLLSRTLIRGADLKWIGLGCVIPDLPWILQRALRPVVPPVWLLDLRLYAMVLATIPFCLLFSAAAALLAAEPRKVFPLLVLNVVLHQLLDASQSKWGNGVLLWAPASWKPTNFGLFWPESPISVGLTALGLVFLIVARFYRPGIQVALSHRPPSRVVAALGLGLIYLILPLAFVGTVESNVDEMRLLRDPAQRPGKEIALDRVGYARTAAGSVVVPLTGEPLSVQGPEPVGSGSVSLRGRFVDENTIEILELHEHWPHLRDLGSYVGLSLLTLVWLADLGGQWFRRRSG